MALCVVVDEECLALAQLLPLLQLDDSSCFALLPSLPRRDSVSDILIDI